MGERSTAKAGGGRMRGGVCLAARQKEKGSKRNMARAESGQSRTAINATATTMAARLPTPTLTLPATSINGQQVTLCKLLDGKKEEIMTKTVVTPKVNGAKKTSMATGQKSVPKPRAKRPKKEEPVKKMVFAKRIKQQTPKTVIGVANGFRSSTNRDFDNEDLFNYRLISDTSSDSDYLNCDSSDSRESLPLPDEVNLVDDDLEDLNQLRTKLINQKWLLTKWIKLKTHKLSSIRRQLANPVPSTSKTASTSTKITTSLPTQTSGFVNSVANLNITNLRKGVCCFSNDDFECTKPTLPFTRHCRQHVLYNVDQLLFERCSAKSSSNSLVQCSNATFDLLNRDRPLCDHHARERAVQNAINATGLARDAREAAKENTRSGSSTALSSGTGFTSTGKVAKKKTKPLALLRPARRKKKKSESVNPVPGKSFPEESDASNSVGFGNPVSITPVRKPGKGKGKSAAMSTPPATRQLRSAGPADVVDFDTGSVNPVVSIPSSLAVSYPNMTMSTVTSTPSLRHAPPTISEAFESGLSAQRTGLSHPVEVLEMDGDVLHLAPGDEALVASLVSELPPLGGAVDPSLLQTGLANGLGLANSNNFEADLNEVLNKMPDYAFNELFNDNLKNGEGPTAEAIEQALATLATGLVNPVPNSNVQKDSSHQVNGLPPNHTLINPVSTYGHQQLTHLIHPTGTGLVNPVPSHPIISTPSTLSTANHVNSVPMVINNLNPVAITPMTTVHGTGLVNPVVTSTPIKTFNDNDIIDNIFGSLTTEQQQQLNGLIDGALATLPLTTVSDFNPVPNSVPIQVPTNSINTINIPVNHVSISSNLNSVSMPSQMIHPVSSLHQGTGLSPAITVTATNPSGLSQVPPLPLPSLRPPPAYSSTISRQFVNPVVTPVPITHNSMSSSMSTINEVSINGNGIVTTSAIGSLGTGLNTNQVRFPSSLTVTVVPSPPQASLVGHQQKQRKAKAEAQQSATGLVNPVNNQKPSDFAIQTSCFLATGLRAVAAAAAMAGNQGQRNQVRTPGMSSLGTGMVNPVTIVNSNPNVVSTPGSVQGTGLVVNGHGLMRNNIFADKKKPVVNKASS